MRQADVAPPGRTLQLRPAPARARTRRARTRRPSSTTPAALTYGELDERVRRIAAALRAAGPAARGARAAADARLQRLAGELSRRALRRPGAGGRQHAADRRRLRLHARALARAGGAGVRRAAAGAARGDDALGPRARQASSCRARSRRCSRARSSSRPSSAAPTPAAQAGRHRGRRSRLLALFVGLHRPAQGHGALARQPLLDRRALRQGRAAAARGRRLLLGGQAVLRLRPGQRADLSAERRRDHAC